MMMILVVVVMLVFGWGPWMKKPWNLHRTRCKAEPEGPKGGWHMLKWYGCVCPKSTLPISPNLPQLSTYLNIIERNRTIFNTNQIAWSQVCLRILALGTQNLSEVLSSLNMPNFPMASTKAGRWPVRHGGGPKLVWRNAAYVSTVQNHCWLMIVWDYNKWFCRGVIIIYIYLQPPKTYILCSIYVPECHVFLLILSPIVALHQESILGACACTHPSHICSCSIALQQKYLTYLFHCI